MGQGNVRDVLQQDRLDVHTPSLRSRFKLNDSIHIRVSPTLVQAACSKYELTGGETHDLLNLGSKPLSIRNNSLQQPPPNDLPQRRFYSHSYR